MRKHSQEFFFIKQFGNWAAENNMSFVIQINNGGI